LFFKHARALWDLALASIGQTRNISLYVQGTSDGLQLANFADVEIALKPVIFEASPP
jgi:hypothetical protein